MGSGIGRLIGDQRIIPRPAVVILSKHRPGGVLKIEIGIRQRSIAGGKTAFLERIGQPVDQRRVEHIRVAGIIQHSRQIAAGVDMPGGPGAFGGVALIILEGAQGIGPDIRSEPIRLDLIDAGLRRGKDQTRIETDPPSSFEASNAPAR